MRQPYLIWYALLLLTGLFNAQHIKAQALHKVTGIIKDSTGEALQGAIIELITGRDTSKTISDKSGKFRFTEVHSHHIILRANSFGYRGFTGEFSIKENAEVVTIAPIILSPESQMLDEVIVRKKPTPVTMKKDTIEYDASAFTIRETDRVDDLLKQLPGVEVDKDGNVTSMGKPVTRLRVNGKDFFTNDVKEYIRQLPADMIARLQVIDDYGDRANFTGNKSGESKKMLNLVTKKGKDHVDFLNANTSAGTDSRYLVSVNANRWQNAKQIAVNGGINNVNSGAGINKTTSLSGNYRDKWGKVFTGSVSYYYSGSNNKTKSTSLSETSSSLGTIYNDFSNESSARSGYHSLNIGINNTGNKKSFLEAMIGIGISDNKTVNNTVSRQTGVIRQDLSSSGTQKQHSPTITASGSWAHSFTKKRRIVSLGFSANNADNTTGNDISNVIGYYNASGSFYRDSLLHSIVNTGNKALKTGGNFSFSEPAGENSDVYFTYLFSSEKNSNRLVTNFIGSDGMPEQVDSLSNIYKYSFIYHQVAFNYRYNYKKINYLLGIGVQPDQLSGEYEGRRGKVSSSNLNLIPLFSFNYLMSLKKSLSFNYRTSNRVPDFLQLQPVRDTRNVQNIINGNPDLKAAFIHTASIEFRVADPEKSTSFQSGLSGDFIKNQVITNVVLVPDTLNGLRQETYYLNANGGYSLSSYYSWFTFLKEKVLSLELQGNVSYNQNISFTDYIKNLSKDLSWSQSARFYYNKPWINFSVQATYENRNNRYTVAGGRDTKIGSWLFGMDGRVFFLKTFTSGINASLRLNQGYNIDVPDPFIINLYVEKWLSKKKRASIKLSVNDLLNQGTGFSRSISDNSITDTRTNQVKRYFLLGFSLRLKNTPAK